MTRVLLVEDNLENADYTIRVLESASYEVCHTVRGLDGMRLVRRERLDLILLDLDLPDINGLTMARMLKTQLGQAAPPIIAVTAQTGVQEMNRAADFGCDAFVSKPFLPDELLQVILVVLNME